MWYALASGVAAIVIVWMTWVMRGMYRDAMRASPPIVRVPMIEEEQYLVSEDWATVVRCCDTLGISPGHAACALSIHLDNHHEAIAGVSANRAERLKAAQRELLKLAQLRRPSRVS